MSYEDQLRELAKSIGSDGCTHALQIHQVCCWEHDWSYVTRTTPRGVATTKAEADTRFRACIQARSPLRGFSPMAWWRWLAVKRFGHGNFLITHQAVTMIATLVDTMHAERALEEAARRRVEIILGEDRYEP